MSAHINEATIAAMDLALKRAEARLDNAEAKQNTTAQRLEELYNSLRERLNAKDDTLVRIRDQSEWTLKQNDTLLKQIGLRWNLITGFTAFIGLAFSLVFVYQVWRVDDIMRTQRNLDQAADKVNDRTAQLTKNTKAYSDILAILAHADSLMTDSNREFLRAEYTVATRRASDATETLKSALQIAGDSFADLEKRTLLYSSTSCGLNAAAPATVEPKAQDSASALNPEALRSTVRDTLYTAYDLHARAAFFATPRGDLRADGIMLLALNDAQWEGYHWTGLAAEDAGFGNEAAECFRRSVDKNQIGNRDYVNLAELSFIHSDFPSALKYSDQYLHPLNHRFKSSLDVVAQFYFGAAGYLANDPEAEEKLAPETFRKMVEGLPDFTLEGTFASGDLVKYLSSKDFSDKVPAEKRGQVQKMADCLIKRTCK